ncbi:AAA family ATPase [Nannocystis pusilla]|uniref:AAA family ATPase n=1 Tax=Nannocystis pusilla TaxID=889268 RepID=A0ABS7U1N2_9BACT|nr:AAA family ATPase [Nannocystis pusilla]MBZ5714435.1 AAA family ATPase [Nannocystis pusilla]
MHLVSFEISNIRVIGALKWRVEPGVRQGWHVFLGPNGAGKSTLLRTIALALVGPKDAAALRQDWRDWLSSGKNDGTCTLIYSDDGERWDPLVGRGPRPGQTYPWIVLTLERLESGLVELDGFGTTKYKKHTPVANVWGSGSGWFSASYGPFRRLRGGDKEAEKLYYSHPRLARHLTVFGEDIALSECLAWMQGLRFAQLEAERAGQRDGGPSGRLLQRLIAFVNQKGFLPHGAQLVDVSQKRVTFKDGNGHEIEVGELSDGYRSILSLTFELIRQLSIAYDPDIIFAPHDPTKIIAPGVVLIDEIDAHLHPSWQVRVGKWFVESFPNMQFLVTTHSPLVCQAAVKGSVYRLPRPGSDEEGRMVIGDELNRLLYGDILDAYETESFGVLETRSEEGEAKLRRLAELNVKRLDEGLDADEEKERAALRRTLPVHQDDLTEEEG